MKQNAHCQKKLSGQKPMPEGSPSWPRLLASQRFIVSCEYKHEGVKPYDVFQPKFSRLATQAVFKEWQTRLVAVDIQEEMRLLEALQAEGGSAYLEIVVPVLSLCDLLDPTHWTQGHSQFCKVMGVHGYGAKASEDFSAAEFILVTDIIGNRFEVLLEDNAFTLPEDGTGLFSIPKTFTFLYSQEQVLQGKGVCLLESHGMQKNVLYVLPPCSEESFSFHVCVTHLEKARRQVDLIRRVEVAYQAEKIKTDWAKAAKRLIQERYSLKQLIQDYLRSGGFSLSETRGYNQFLLLPEAFRPFYQLLLKDSLRYPLSAKMLFKGLSVPEDMRLTQKRAMGR